MLGFEDDERDYAAAALMLRVLNCTRIVLLTNNPAKLDGLTKAGIEITARVPLEAPINPHNRRYLTTKAERSGHKFGTLKASAGESEPASVELYRALCGQSLTCPATRCV